VADLLVRSGADVNAKDNEGKTPLFCAVKYGNRNIARALERYTKDAVGHQHSKPRAVSVQPTVAYTSTDCSKGGNKNHLGLCPECPDCGGLLEFGEGCAFCRGCGFSKCG
jgi:hypothetical protein